MPEKDCRVGAQDLRSVALGFRLKGLGFGEPSNLVTRYWVSDSRCVVEYMGEYITLRPYTKPETPKTLKLSIPKS